MKFVTLAAICKFDDMYASALQDNKMSVAGGKKLKRYYFRRHRYILQDEDIKLDERQDPEDVPEYSDVLGIPPVGYYKDKPIYANPQTNCCLKFMRFLVKSFRVFYVSVLYYFMPFVFIFLTFINSTADQQWYKDWKNNELPKVV